MRLAKNLGVELPDRVVQDAGETNPKKVWDKKRAGQGTRPPEQDEGREYENPKSYDVGERQAAALPRKKEPAPDRVYNEL